MGNSETTILQNQKFRCFEKAERRYEQFVKSNQTPLSELYKPQYLKDYLRPGDIVSRLVSSNSDTYSNAGDRRLYDQYGIYVKYLGNDKHRVIQKSHRDAVIEFLDMDSEELSLWKLAVDSRYEDTLDVALWVKSSNIDAGFSSSHANSEHFVVFCLTRCTVYSRTRDASGVAIIRNAFAVPSCAIGNLAKAATHPFYMLTGDMTLSERMVKTKVPFGMDGEAVASGKTIVIGYTGRDMWHYWLEIDKQPSAHTLHQDESKYPEEDYRVIKHHRSA